MKFKVFIGIALVLIILLQASIVGLLVYGGIKVKQTATDAKETLRTDNISKNLNQANDSLKKISSELQSSPYSSSAASPYAGYQLR